MNPNNPDFAKHVKAATASRAEMDKWRTIEIIDAIAAVLSLVIAWQAGSWIIAIAGIVVCGGIGAYATSKKEKARQDGLDHLNRADGMSESLVGATRGRREAENALAGAISQLDEASSKLRRASTYDEKKKAEAEVVSAQAAIEGAKLRLQQATTREASESQRSQQQAKSDVEQTNQSSQESLEIGFSGEKVLANDSYKIYLVKKYKIEKNDVLGKFICSERLFDSIDEALTFAGSQENPTSEKTLIPEIAKMPEALEIPEVITSIQEFHNIESKGSKKIAGKGIKSYSGILILFFIILGLSIILFVMYDKKVLTTKAENENVSSKNKSIGVGSVTNQKKVIPEKDNIKSIDVQNVDKPQEKSKPIEIKDIEIIFQPNSSSFYPAASRNNGEQGKAVIRLFIDKAGNVEDVALLTSTNYSSLDNAATKIGKAYKFKPYLVDGVPNRVYLNLLVSFSTAD